MKTQFLSLQMKLLRKMRHTGTRLLNCSYQPHYIRVISGICSRKIQIFPMAE